MNARVVWLLAAKDLRLMARQPGSLFFVLLFPVLFGVLFGLIFSSASSGDARLDVAVVDLDRSEESADFLARLGERESLVVHSAESQESAVTAVRRRQVVAALVLEEGFAKGVDGLLDGGPALAISGVYDPARGAERAMLTGVLTEVGMAAVFEKVLTRESAESALDRIDTAEASTLERAFVAAARARLGSAGETLFGGDGDGDGAGIGPGSIASIELEPAESSLSNGTSNSFEITFPQAAAWALVGCVTAFGLSIASERSRGTLRRLVTAPIGPGEIVASKALACFVASFCVLALLYVVGFMWFGVRIDRPVMLAGVLAIIAYAFVGLMVLLAAIARSEAVSDGFIRGVLLVLALVGGAGVPLAFIQGWLRTLSHASPFAWSILALEGATFRGLTAAEMALPVGVLVGVGTVCLAVGAGLSRLGMRGG